MYSLLTFMMTLCAYGFVVGRERFVAAGFIGAIYTHYFGFYLAPAVLVFYVKAYDGAWKPILGRVLLYGLAYLPWIAVALQGLAFHAGRTGGLRHWSFHSINLARQVSGTVALGILASLLRFRRGDGGRGGFEAGRAAAWDGRDLLRLVAGLFLVTGLFLIPFHRYLVPFLPVLIALGVVGLTDIWEMWTGHRRGRMARTLVLPAALLGLLAPNPQAYGIFPQLGRFLDLRDAIHVQEWREVVEAIPGGSVATPNARSLLFYSNLQGLRSYDVHQFDEDPEEFRELLDGAEVEWIVLPEIPLYEPHVAAAEAHGGYERHLELDHTTIYRRGGGVGVGRSLSIPQ
jgi:hypothetical protein